MIVERGGRDGWAVAAADGVTVALDTALDDELLLEGGVFDLIRDGATRCARTQGFEVTDRIVLTVPEAEAELVAQHADWIKREVLAVEIRIGGDEIAIEKA